MQSSSETMFNEKLIFSNYLTEFLNGQKISGPSKQMIPNFEEWAEDYENDEGLLFNKRHILLAELVEDVLKSETHITKSCSVLDIAAGTGWVGEALRLKGFKGLMDAHDGSEKMLEMAKKKEGVYTNYFVHMIESHTSMPKELASESYEIVTVAGALRFGLISYKCINQLFGALIVGGLLCFSSKLPVDMQEFEFRCALERKFFMLVDEGYVELVDMRFCKGYRKSIKELEKIHPPSVYLYCYKKLKSF